MGNVCECRGKVGGRESPNSQTERERPPQQVTEDDLDSNEDDDDVVDDLPMPSAKVQAKNRQSVSAEVYGEWNKKTHFVPPFYPKTEEEKQRIRDIVENSFLFSSLEAEDLEVLLGAFKELKVPKDTTIIEQGADGDKLYLIEEGEANVYKKISPSQQQQQDKKSVQQNEQQSEDKQQQQQLVNVMVAGELFGELALMYNSPRAATVKSKTDMKLWALDRQTFTLIVRDAAAKKREIYEDSLKEVELLKDVDAYERAKIADALKTRVYEEKEVIIKEGEEGDTFYLLLDGEAEVIKENKVVMNYKRGSYFGELALLKNQPRAATVIAKTACKVAYMQRKSFKRLLGPLEDMLKRNLKHYKAVMQQLGLDATYLDQ